MHNPSFLLGISPIFGNKSPNWEKLKNWFWYILAAVGLYYGYNLYILSKSFSINLKGVSLGGSLASQQVILNFSISNPSNAGVLLQGIAGSVLLNGNIIGTINSNQNNLPLSANTTTEIQVPVQLSDAGLLATVLGIVNNGVTGTVFDVKGTVIADFAPIPFESTYSI